MANLMKTLTIGGTAYEVCDANARETLTNKASYEDMNAVFKKAAPRNLLDNSDFRNPVNQRGATSYASSGYVIDRWKIPGAITVDVLDSSVKLTCTSTSTANGMSQYYEHPPTAGTKLTVAMMEANGTLHVGSATMPSSSYNVALTTTNGVKVRLVTDRMAIMVPVGESIELKWVALYEGEYTAETIPEYQPKGYGAELKECQRYYIRIGADGKNTPLGTVVGYTSTGAYLALPGFHMRDTYTVQMVTDISTLKYTRNTINNGVSATGVAGYNAHTGGVIALSINGSFSAGDSYTIWLVSGIIEISADLG